MQLNKFDDKLSQNQMNSPHRQSISNQDLEKKLDKQISEYQDLEAQFEKLKNQIESYGFPRAVSNSPDQKSIPFEKRNESFNSVSDTGPYASLNKLDDFEQEVNSTAEKVINLQKSHSDNKNERQKELDRTLGKIKTHENGLNSINEEKDVTDAANQSILVEKDPIKQENENIRYENEALLRELSRQQAIYREMLAEFYKMVALNEHKYVK